MQPRDTGTKLRCLGAWHLLLAKSGREGKGVQTSRSTGMGAWWIYKLTKIGQEWSTPKTWLIYIKPNFGAMAMSLVYPSAISSTRRCSTKTAMNSMLDSIVVPRTHNNSINLGRTNNIKQLFWIKPKLYPNQNCRPTCPLAPFPTNVQTNHMASQPTLSVRLSQLVIVDGLNPTNQ